MLNTKSDVTGLRLTNVLEEIYSYPITTKSNFAREYATEIAYLSCDKMITVIDYDGMWGNIWRITIDGLIKLIEKNHEQN